MIVNHQHHWYPRSFLDLIEGRASYPRTRSLGNGRYLYEMGGQPGSWKFEIDSNFSSIDEQIADMDEAGIDVAVLSPNMVGEVDLVDLGEAKETIAFLNEEVAAAQRRFPGRIAGLAMLPMQDIDAAIEALDRAVELDLRGVFITSNIAGRPQASKESLPIFERINHYGLPLYLHPSSNSMLFDRGLNMMVDTTAGWVYDTSTTALQLITNGILDRCPDIEVIHLHLGGVVPYIWGRVAKYAPKYLDLEHSIDHYLRTRFYVDIVCHAAQPIPLAVETYGADRLLYGDDYPWHSHQETLKFVDDHFSANLARKVLHENQVKSLRLG